MMTLGELRGQLVNGVNRLLRRDDDEEWIDEVEGWEVQVDHGDFCEHQFAPPEPRFAFVKTVEVDAGGKRIIIHLDCA